MPGEVKLVNSIILVHCPALDIFVSTNAFRYYHALSTVCAH